MVHFVKIEFNNLTDSAEINFPILFLKGTVLCETCNLFLDGNLCITDNDGGISEFSIREGKFKSICELKLGINLFKFSYSAENHFGHKSLSFLRRLHRSSNVLKLVYVIPKGCDGRFQSLPGTDNSVESASKRIVTGAKLIQSLVAERLFDQGFGRKTFKLYSEDDKEAQCEIFQSVYPKEDFHNLSSEQIWALTAKELLENKIITESVKVLAFLSCTKLIQSSAEILSSQQYTLALSNVKGYVACGKGHLAMLGAAGLHSWAPNLKEVVGCLTSSTPVDSTLFDDSGFRGTMGGCYATTLGSALHELGHIFNLVHADNGIMARGFEDLDLFFTISNCELLNTENQDGRAFFHPSAAILLAAHPWFSEELVAVDDYSKNSIQLCGLEAKAINGIRLIELHSEDGNLIKFWDFSKNLFPLHRFCVSIYDVRPYPNAHLLIQDRLGHIVTQLVIPPF